MNQPIQLTGQVYAVEVPAKVENLNLYRINGYAIMIEWDDVERPLNVFTHVKIDEYYGELKYYKWPIVIGTTRGLTEDQAKDIVERTHAGGFGRSGEEFKNYVKPSPVCFNALKSLKSLLKSKGLDENKNYVLLRKN